jgi:hypothetical protein
VCDSLVFSLGSKMEIQKKKMDRTLLKIKKLSNYRKLTNNQPIASYCRDPN